MTEHLTVVTETISGCCILRDLRGSYVVRHRHHGDTRHDIATLAAAYAACQVLDPRLNRADGGAGRAGLPAGYAPT
ncbi:MAG: hypothetical protein ACKO3F_08700 [Cyanobium sp.]